jgi:hypothetical protein
VSSEITNICKPMTWTIAIVISSAGVLSAQTPSGSAARPSGNPALDQLRAIGASAQVRESRYQIGQMERVLEGAVEHGATVIRDRLQALMPADMLLAENARARGFRLDGYGIFFDVQVPSLEGTLPWSFRTLDQNSLGLDNALQTLRAFIQASAANDVNLQQALKRIELQMPPSVPPSDAVATPVSGSAGTTNSVATPTGGTSASATPAASQDDILSNPNEAYRTAIRSALIDAMLEHSRGLSLGPNDWLTVAARGTDNRPSLGPADNSGQTVMLNIRGGDLTAFLGGQISRDEALKRVEVRVF